MNAERIVKAAIPNAPDWLVEHVVWGRTPYPCGAITPRSLYKAASGYRRAAQHGIELCEFCDRPAMKGLRFPVCQRCDESLSKRAHD